MYEEILLIVPPCYENREMDFEIGIPIHLEFLAIPLRKNGRKVEFLDMTLLEKNGLDSYKELEHRLCNPTLKIIGISSHTVRTSITTGMVADFVKKNRQDLKVVVGGVNATFMWEEILNQYISIDFVMRGYSQINFSLLVENIITNNWNFTVPGLVYKKKDEIICSHLSNIEPEDFPCPKLEALHPTNYTNWTKTYPLLTHTGCLYSCNFCTSVIPTPSKKEVYRTIPIILTEMENALNVGFKRFFMSANNFTSDKNWVLNFCQELMDSGLSQKCNWSCMARVDNIDNEILQKMQMAGCDNIAFGVESTDERQWKLLNKGGYSFRAIQKAFELSKINKLDTTAFIILGTPEQTQEEIEKIITSLRVIDPDFRVISFFQPFPGTPYWKNTEEFGLSEIEPLSEWNFYEHPICRTKYNDKGKLVDYMYRLYFDRGSGIGIRPEKDFLEITKDYTYNFDMPESTMYTFDLLSNNCLEDALQKTCDLYGTRGRLISIYWLSAAFRDNVVRIV